MDILESVIEQTSYETEYMLERGKPMPSKNHGKLQLRIGRLLDDKYGHQLDVSTEVSLDLTSGKATPDVVVYPYEEYDWLDDDEVKRKEAPLMVVEILSPTQAIDDIKDKIFDIYFAAGVKSAWVVIPTFQTIYVVSPNRKVQTFTSGIVKDDNVNLELDIASIFSTK